MSAKKLVSVVSPAYNEADSLPELVRRLKQTLEKSGSLYEIVIVENGSTDNSLQVLQQLHKEDPHVKYLKLSRNFGHQAALVAGLEYCHGDCAVTIDADLQQPPELIAEMIRLWQQGFDVVFTTKSESGNIPLVKKFGMALFYKIISFLAHMKLSYGQSDFRLIDRKVINVLKNIPEREKFLRGLIYWMGFKQTGLTYKVDARHAGESKFSLINLAKFAVNGILSFSIFPLRIYLYSGLALSALCFTYGLAAIVLKTIQFFRPQLDSWILLPRGWTTVIYFITFLGGFQLIGIGLLGEYLGKTLKQVKGRPVYIVDALGDEERA